MRPESTILLILAGLIAIVGPVASWFGRGLQSLVLITTGSPAAALYTYHTLLLPGTLLHELSHLGMAKLLRVRTGRLSLRPQLQSANMAQFGSVEIGATDPLRESLIGLAPLLMGLLSLYAIVHWHLGVWAEGAEVGNLAALGSQLVAAPGAALWLYMIIAIGNAMLPSASDRRAWRKVGLGLALTMALLYVAGLPRSVPSAWVTIGRQGAQIVALSLLLVVVADLLLGSFFWLAARVVGWVTSRTLLSDPR